MNLKKKIGELIAKLNTGFVNHTIKIKHKYNKNLEKILYILTKEGVIYGYEKDLQTNNFHIFLKLKKETKQVTKLILKSKVSSPQFIKNYKIYSMCYKDYSTLPVTSSNKGIIVNKTGQIKGGEFLFIIK